MPNRKTGRTLVRAAVSLALVAGLSPGCLSLRTEHDVKPIRITMDVNLRIDRQLDAYLDDIYGEAPAAAARAAAAE